MPTFVVLEIEGDPALPMRSILPRHGVQELARAETLADLMNAVEDAEIAACALRRAKVEQQAGDARDFLLRLVPAEPVIVDWASRCGLYDLKPAACAQPADPPVDDDQDDDDQDDFTPIVVGDDDGEPN